MTLLKRNFLIFHYQNPELWHWIDHFALEVARSGRQHFSIANIIERARLETIIKTKGDHLFKISNSHRAYYARLWMLIHPEYNGFFKTKYITDDGLPDCNDYGPLKETIK